MQGDLCLVRQGEASCRGCPGTAGNCCSFHRAALPLRARPALRGAGPEGSGRGCCTELGAGAAGEQPPPGAGENKVCVGLCVGKTRCVWFYMWFLKKAVFQLDLGGRNARIILGLPRSALSILGLPRSERCRSFFFFFFSLICRV